MVDKALENAKEIAELTGRTTKEVIADILDDGVLNTLFRKTLQPLIRRQSPQKNYKNYLLLSFLFLS